MKLFLFIFVFAIFNAYFSFAQRDLCDYNVEIIANNSAFQSQDFSWRMKAVKIEGAQTNITGTAQIEDSKGQIMKRYKPWVSETISKQKTSSEYSPNLKEGIYKLIVMIDVACNDTKMDNNADFRLIKIVNQKNISNNTLMTQQKEKSDEETDNIIMLRTKENQKNKPLQSVTADSKEPVIYQSSNEKAKTLIVFFLLGLSILLNIVLIWKR